MRSSIMVALAVAVLPAVAAAQGSGIKVTKDVSVEGRGNLSSTGQPLGVTGGATAEKHLATCNYDTAEVRKVAIKTEYYREGMITPDEAKAIALCAVPGQIGSGEMEQDGNGTHYAIDILPDRKQTHTKVLVDANTGAVISSKQFGGLRGAAGYVRESAERQKNKAKAQANDSTTIKP